MFFPSPFAAFETWTGMLMTPWMTWVHGSPWAPPPLFPQDTSADDTPSPAMSPFAFTPLGMMTAFAPALEQAFSTANRTADALAEAMAKSNGGPVQVDIADTSGPFSIRVSIALGGTEPEAEEGPIIDHEGPEKALPSK